MTLLLHLQTLGAPSVSRLSATTDERELSDVANNVLRVKAAPVRLFQGGNDHPFWPLGDRKVHLSSISCTSKHDLL